MNAGFTPTRKPNFSFIPDALHQDGITANREPGDTFLKFNFDLCRAIDMTSVGIVLSKMAEAGWLDCREAELFHMQAGALLAQMRTANNRAYASRMEARQGGDGVARLHAEHDSLTANGGDAQPSGPSPKLQRDTI